MCHVEQGTSCVALNSHVLRTSESCEGHKSTRFGDSGFVIICKPIESNVQDRGVMHTMRSEISDTANCVTLDLNIRAQHLADKGFQAAKLDYKELVVGLGVVRVCRHGMAKGHVLLTARFPRAALAAR